jgi:histidine kinase/DNA gyrase B/HSP90-like ATPase
MLDRRQWAHRRGYRISNAGTGTSVPLTRWFRSNAYQMMSNWAVWAASESSMTARTAPLVTDRPPGRSGRRSCLSRESAPRFRNTSICIWRRVVGFTLERRPTTGPTARAVTARTADHRSSSRTPSSTRRPAVGSRCAPATPVAMRPSRSRRLGERFYRVDSARTRERGGAGLGLSIAFGIAAAHRGTVQIQSEQGRGTRVTLRLAMVR